MIEGNVFGKQRVLEINFLADSRFVNNDLYRCRFRPLSSCLNLDWGPNPHSGISVVFTGNTANASAVVSSVNVAAAVLAGLVVGMEISGAGVPASTTVLSYDSGAGTVTLSANATATATGVSLTATDITGLVGETPWWPLTLLHSWAVVAGNVAPQYRKHQDGTIEFCGVLKDGVAGEVAFEVHDGYTDQNDYSPGVTRRLVAHKIDTGAGVPMIVFADGTVILDDTSSAGVSLEGVRYTNR